MTNAFFAREYKSVLDDTTLFTRFRLLDNDSPFATPTLTPCISLRASLLDIV